MNKKILGTECPNGAEGEQMIYGKYTIGKISENGKIDHFEIRKHDKSGRKLLKGYYVSKTFVGDLFEQLKDKVMDTFFKLDGNGNMQIMIGALTYEDLTYKVHMSGERIIFTDNGETIGTVFPARVDDEFEYTQASVMTAFNKLQTYTSLKHEMTETDGNTLHVTISELVKKL